VSPKRTAFYRLAQWVVRVLYFRFKGGIEVSGLENIPSEGPLLVAPTHMSLLDPPAVGCVMPRMTCFMAKEEIFHQWPIGKIVGHLGAFPVKRGQNDSGAIRKAIDILKSGQALLMFPEGKRGDGEHIGAIQPGIAMLAKRSGALVLPVGLLGTKRPSGTRCRVRVVFGKPFGYEEVAGGDGTDSRAQFVDALRSRLLEVSAQAGLPLKISPIPTAQPDSHPAETEA